MMRSRSNGPHSPELTRRAIWFRLLPIPANCRKSAGSTVGAGVRRWGCATPRHCSRIHSASWALGQSSRRRSSSASETRILIERRRFNGWPAMQRPPLRRPHRGYRVASGAPFHPENRSAPARGKHPRRPLRRSPANADSSPRQDRECGG
ncbi:Uncharacterised protein [Acinetobacter baumannii]|nr:Uncharacterised protein [Acinetobacter baumannii]